MFRFGLCKAKGCQGKAKNCSEFHPKLCNDHVKGICDGFECTKGFHLRSITKKIRSEATKDDPQEPRVPVPTAKQGNVIVREEVIEKPKEKNFLEQSPEFMNKLLETLQSIRTQQAQQQEQIAMLIKNQDQSPPRWALSWRNLNQGQNQNQM